TLPRCGLAPRAVEAVARARTRRRPRRRRLLRALRGRRRPPRRSLCSSLRRSGRACSAASWAGSPASRWAASSAPCCSAAWGGGFGGGIGLLELLLIGGAAFLVFRMLRGRSDARPEPAYAGAYGSADRGWPAGSGTVMEAPPGESDLDRGVGHIRSMDGSFDPTGFAEWAKGTFADVQAGIARRD